MQQRWIFGYGSLMWRPGFEFESQAHGRIRGFHRSLCVYSLHHRGTEALPGLVLGLDRGGSCVGVAFQIKAFEVGGNAGLPARARTGEPGLSGSDAAG